MTAAYGNKVVVKYTGTTEDGRSLALDEGGKLEFVLGQNQVIPGFEREIMGMDEGESKSFTIPPDEGFGVYNEQAKHRVDRKDFPEDLKLEVGDALKVPREDGGKAIYWVTELDDETAVLDGNHPLAGQELHFEVEVVEVANGDNA